MNEYTFSISLRITHPNIDPEIITSQIGITPFRSYKVGDERVSPKGTALPGLNRETFWAAKLHEIEKLDSNDVSLEKYIGQCNSKLQSHRELFCNIVSSGGYVEYFIGWFGSSNLGSSLSPDLMRETSSLCIAIGLDIYLD